MLKRGSLFSKLMTVYIFSLFLVIMLVSYYQIKDSLEILNHYDVQNLSMLTERIALEFDENQNVIGRTLYSKFAELEIPRMMADYHLANGENKRKLTNTLAQMVTNFTDYDFVMLELENGARLDSGRKNEFTLDAYWKIFQSSNSFLDSNPQINHGISQWYRDEDGEIYILRDVYEISPLHWVGRAVFHMRNRFFYIGGVNENITFLFFDRSGKFLTPAGAGIPDEIQDALVQMAESGKLEKYNTLGKDEYLAVVCTKNGWTTIGLSSMEVYRKIRRQTILNGVLYGCISGILGCILLTVLMQSFRERLHNLNRAMDHVAKGEFGFRVQADGEDDISRLLLAFNHMSNRIGELMQENVDKERLKKAAEFQMLEYKYRSLETQIKPHFIYNAMEALNSVAKIKGTPEISEIVQLISRYFRNIAANVTKQFIIVRKEFDGLKDYTKIYHFIYGERVEVRFFADMEVENAVIPTMILQPIVENALQHGVRTEEELSCISVEAYAEHENLILTVRDRGYGLTPKLERILQSGGAVSGSDHGGIGIVNIKERLKLIYGDRASIEIRNHEECGVIVKISLPFSMETPDFLDE